MTAFYSALHFLVDGVCAYSMLGRLREGFLLYNFCAFVLQLPLGAVLDRAQGKKMPLVFSALGCVLTLAGAFGSPAVLGLGNALFHVGGGVDIIREDTARHRGGALLGIFVAPGAMGLYVGGLLAGRGGLLLWAAASMGALLALRSRLPDPAPAEAEKLPGLWAAVVCFAVVVLRSFVGTAADFPWKTGIWSFLATVMVVAGKVLGGQLAARYGARMVAGLSLVLAAVGFSLGDGAPFGLLALLCFNMTMPLTLYALWRRFPQHPGTVFGALTLALFLGYLPGYFGIHLPMDGVGGSILSLLLLWNCL